MAVRFAMGPKPRTHVRSSQQLTRDSNFSATGKDASGALGKVICQSSATGLFAVQWCKNITWRCVNKMELTDINLLEKIQPKKIQAIQAQEILRKTIRPSQKNLHLLA